MGACLTLGRKSGVIHYDPRTLHECVELINDCFFQHAHNRFDKGIARLIAEYVFVMKTMTDQEDPVVEWQVSPHFEFSVNFKKKQHEKYHGLLLDVTNFKGLRFKTLENRALHFGFGVSTKKGFEAASLREEGWQRWDGVDTENFILFDNHYCSFQRDSWVGDENGSFCGIGHITQLDLTIEDGVWNWIFYDKKGTLLGQQTTTPTVTETVYPVIVVAFCGWFMQKRVTDESRNRKAKLAIEFL